VPERYQAGAVKERIRPVESALVNITPVQGFNSWLTRPDYFHYVSCMPPVPTVLPDGAKIRAMRSERGWEVRELARRIRRSRQLVWSVERGEATGKVTMRRFARAFSVDLSEIVLTPEGRDEASAQPESSAA
jgi:DNA-binding XRE family transcriptional regulator